MSGGGTKMPKGSHIERDFQLDNTHGVRYIPLRKVKATIFYRPDFDVQTNKWVYNKKRMNWKKIDEIQDKIEEWYPKLNFKKKNGR